jgi:anaerobic selenocysteine-containing dehydrogenase
MDESEIHARLILAVSGMHGADPASVDDLVIERALTKAVAEPHSPLHGGDPKQLAALLTGRTGPERRLDMMLRLGPYDLVLADLLARPHGVDLGPLEPRLAQVLKTRSGKVELLPRPIAADLPRLRRALDERPAALVLVGRRHLRSNNSWLHNIPSLNGGSNRCTLQVHPDDAARLGLHDGEDARIAAEGGELKVPVEVTDAVRAGVVSLPHGWGHDREGARMAVAAATPGVNVNQLLDGSRLDPLSGTAVLNGFPVDVTPIS